MFTLPPSPAACRIQAVMTVIGIALRLQALADSW